MSIVYTYPDLQQSRSVNVFLFLNCKAKHVTVSAERGRPVSQTALALVVGTWILRTCLCVKVIRTGFSLKVLPFV